ncbi:MAG TPA: pyruvate formate lyase family protein [Candidatus Hydrogenedentes bacterium]|nr:pyruvate formate lyase family protein [Candidatus Hydrogenedentota bacterium]HQM48034.1 pyruvate formate lyase family protein [Candidatus Hydrogenedentota bacterium]
MPGQRKDMSRRDFVGTVSRMAALGGGLYLMGDAAAHTQAEVALQKWSAAWRPEPPKRLSDLTHELAARALGGEHGRSMVKTDFALDESAVAALSPDLRYAKACQLVAERAPLRILPGEKVVGSATLIEAAAHQTPAAGISSISHTTLGFDRVLQEGYGGLRKRIEERLARGGFENQYAAPAYLAEDSPGKVFRTSGNAAHWASAAPRAEYDTPPLTVECRARINSKDGFNVLVLNRNKDSSRHWEIYSYAGTGCFSAYLPGYAPAEVKSGRFIADGQWHHLAMTFDGVRVALFVDGEQVASEAVQAKEAPDAGEGALYFGAYPPHSIGCDGAIAEVRISNAIRDIAPGGAPLEAEPHTAGLWRVGEADGKPALADASRFNNTASFSPGPRTSEDLLTSMLMCLDAASAWHQRYMDELTRLAETSTGEERQNYLEVRETLRRVPENPPQTFREAVQSLWFMYAFQRLMGTWSGIGRIDAMLGPYLERDLAEGRIALDEARELLAHFWIKGCEWIGAFDTRGSGDAQHYQNIVLSGIGPDGKDVTNAVTYLVLDVVEELHISDFPIAVRLNSTSPEQLLRRMAEVQRHGGGIVAAYNEEVAIEGLVKFGYPLEEARAFANDGCWETIIPGKTCFIYRPFDGLSILQDALALRGREPVDYPDFEALYAACLERLARAIDEHHRAADGWALNGMPTPLVSMFVDGCVEKGRSYHDRGATYTVFAAHIGRLANVANSLLVIKKLVYEDNYLTLPEFLDVVRNDWEGQENLRQLVLNRSTFYGNDDDEADAMAVRVFNDYTDLVARVRERNGVLRPAGISTFGREIEWRNTGSSPDGHRCGELLATNCSPSPGTDKQGPTAVLRSYCKLDFTRSPNGATVELKIHPESVKGEKGVDAMVALMRTFVSLGGWFMHTDVVDSAMLLDAQRHPEKYPNLSVRIAGWSARFATLTKDWQDMVINRTQQIV